MSQPKTKKGRTVPFSFTKNGVQLTDAMAKFLEEQNHCSDEAEQIIALLMLVSTRCCELGIPRARVIGDLLRIWEVSEEVVSFVRQHKPRDA